MSQISAYQAFGSERHLQRGQRGTDEVESAADTPHVALVVRLQGDIEATNCNTERNSWALLFLIAKITSSMPDFRIEQIMLLVLKTLAGRRNSWRICRYRPVVKNLVSEQVELRRLEINVV